MIRVFITLANSEDTAEPARTIDRSRESFTIMILSFWTDRFLETA